MFKRILIFIIPLFMSFFLKAQVQVEWTAIKGLDYDENTGALTKTEKDGWNNAGAISLNRLDANEDGMVSYVVNDINSDKAIGLSTKNYLQEIKSLDYALVFYHDKLSIYESGKFRGQFGKIKIGDEFSIERTGNEIIFKKNGRFFRKRPTNPNYELFVDVSIFNQGATISGIKSSFYKPIKIKYTTQDISCDDALNGAIDITIDGGKPPYTYLWKNGATTEDLTGLDIGRYYVEVIDANNKKTKEEIYIFSKVVWTDLEGVEVIDGNLIKVKYDKFKEGAAASVNILNPFQDGMVSYTVEDLNYTRVIGLTHQNNFGKGYFDTDYAMFLSTNGTISIFERGKFIGEINKYNVGDKLVIKRVGSLILFFSNEKEFYKINAKPEESLIVDVALLETDATLKNVRTDFCNIPFSVNYSLINEKIDALGSINLTPISGTPPYTYKWEDGDSTQNRTNLPSGIYKVDVIDNSNEKVSLFIPVGVEIQWKHLDEFLVFSNEELRKTLGKEDWEKSKAVLLNEPIGDGEVMAKVIELGVEWTFGYISEDKVEVAKDYHDLLYGLYVDRHNDLYSFDKEVGLKIIGTVTQGDFISIKMVESKVVYFKNGVEIGVSKFKQNKFKILFLLNSLTKTKPIVIGLPLWPKVSASIKHNVCFIPHNGAIDIKIIGGAYPYTYNWSGPNGFTANTEDLNGLVAGIYQVIITGSNLISITKTYEIGQQVNWTNAIGVQVNGNALTKIEVNNWGTSGASSVNNLPTNGNGWMEYSVDIFAQDFSRGIVGFAQNDGNQDLNDVDYGIYFNQVLVGLITEFQAYELGIPVGSLMTGFTSTDIFKVERKNTSTTPIIEYSKNGVVFYSTSSGVTVNELVVDAALYAHETSIINVNSSYGCEENNNFQYVKLKNRLDGGYYYMYNKILRFQANEEYEIGVNRLLAYSIYDKNHNLKAGFDLSGASLLSGSPQLKNNLGENKFDLNVSQLGLTIGEYYTLEVINDKMEKKVLKFKVYN